MENNNAIELYKFYIHLKGGDLKAVYVSDAEFAVKIINKIRQGYGMLFFHLVKNYHTKEGGLCCVYDEAEENDIDNVLVINMCHMVYAAIDVGLQELDTEYHPLISKM